MSLVIGIDIGGSKVKGVLMDDTGRIINGYERPTGADRPRGEILSTILEVINKLKTEGVEKLGVAIAGFALPNGMMACMPNIKKLEGVKLKKELEKGTGLRVFLENDANCFALAEQRKGAARDCKNVIGVIIGTGVGTGIIINGEIYRGAIGGAGECGHAKLVVDSEVKEVEDLIAGPSIIRRYEQLSSNKAEDPWVMLNKKDVFAQKVYDEFVLFTGLFFSNLINTFNPEMIVVGGGVSNIPFYKDVDKVVKKYAQPDMAGICRIRKNALGDDSGVLGAAELALKQP
jgi:predicted NBD/HSP70 family sugar kinase